MKKAKALAASARMGTQTPQGILIYILDSYIRSTFLYNAMLIPNLKRLKDVGDKIYRALLQLLLRCTGRRWNVRSYRG